ncbi:hypothetical protein M0812_14076 [Anaeramoeba flamelloides]|uniref:SEC7 domain-containing protein n=1 Tax=Anaeramoeba flamelloides TaxID=1746091 RepID=A0AAV7ZKM7_9EUKA|nr:hypothetical protein M0812_14076 [Anaeramoeba flamelloides]
MNLHCCLLLLTVFFLPVLLANTKVPVTCGSIIRLQNVNTKNYLHSHNLKYGTGSGQQSATGIRDTDDSGSLWIIKAKHGHNCKQGEAIKNGDIIRFEHLATQKNLHSHNHKSPLSRNQEVSAFGSNSDGNRDDDFEVVTEKVWYQDQIVSFKHTNTGFYLADSGKRYNRPIQGQTEICAIDQLLGKYSKELKEKKKTNNENKDKNKNQKKHTKNNSTIKISPEQLFELLKPFTLAIKTRIPKFIIPSLHVLEKLVSYGFIEYNYLKPKSQSAKMIEKIMETVSCCVNLDDQTVQILITNLMFTMLMSKKLALNGKLILTAINIILEIFYYTNYEQVVITIRMSLIQIINFLLQKVEDFSQISIKAPQNNNDNENQFDKLYENDNNIKDQNFSEELILTSESFEYSNESAFNTRQYSKQIITEIINNSFGNIILATQKPFDSKNKNKNDGNVNDDENENNNKKANRTIEKKASSNVLNKRKSQKNLISGKNFEPVTIQEQSVLDLLKEDSNYQTIYEKDACMVFLSLYLGSVRDFEQRSKKDRIHSNETRFKVINLFLLKIIVQKSGLFLSSSKNFIDLIQNNLCLSNEIGIFLDKIFLKLLSSKNTKFPQKMSVLNVFYKLCNEPQNVVDIFVNYDCDLEATNLNIFERLVNSLSHIAQERYSQQMDNWITQIDHNKLKKLSIRILVKITKSIMIWCDDLDAKKKQNINLKKTRKRKKIRRIKGKGKGKGKERLIQKEKKYNVSKTENSEIEKNDNTKTNTNTNTNTNYKKIRKSKSQNEKLNVNKKENEVTLKQNNYAEKISYHHLQRLKSFHDTVKEKLNYKSPDEVSKEKKKKQSIQKGIELFNKKPNSGIKFMIDINELENTIEGITHFLQNTQLLDLEMIGEYLGSEKEFNINVLHYWVDQMEFTDLDFYSALRKFLSGFRLPGESQKISRIMEKFADRYCNNNPHIFRSADTAYVLAYSVIMLHTDAHSKQIKHKMTKEEFLSNNRGIDSGQNLPEEFLSKLYDDVVTIEMKLRSDQEKLMKRVGEFLTPKQKQEMYKQESQSIILDSQELLKKLKKKSGNKNLFYTATHVSHARPMFEIAWYALLASFSNLLEQSQDRTINKLCLFGFRYAIKIASVFYMEFERDAFVTSLSKFTLLSNTGEMKNKNIESIKILLFIAQQDGDYLQKSWDHVLQCISQLDFLKLIGKSLNNQTESQTNYQTNFLISSKLTRNGVDVDVDVDVGIDVDNILNDDIDLEKNSENWNENENGNENGNEDRDKVRSKSISRNNTDIRHFKKHSNSISNFSTHKESEQLHKRKNLKIINTLDIESINSLNVSEQIDNILIDKIYLNTTNLNNNSIVTFIEHLCFVSEKELQCLPKPRLFSLQKLIEVACYNLTRIRIVWSQIWGTLSNHLTKYSCLNNEEVSLYCINGLRQIIKKFLEKKELQNYQFQGEILKPFCLILKHQKSIDSKVYTIQSLDVMIALTWNNINSGWNTILKFLKITSRDNNLSVLNYGIEFLKRIIDMDFYFQNKFIYMKFIACISNFGKNLLNNEKNSLYCLEVLNLINDKLLIKFNNGDIIVGNNGDIIVRNNGDNIGGKNSDEISIEKDKRIMNLLIANNFFFLIYQALLEIMKISKLKIVKENSLKILLQIINKSYSSMNKKVLRDLFEKIFFNLLDETNIKNKIFRDDQNYLLIFINLIEKIIYFYLSVFNQIPSLFPKILQMLKKLICHEIRELVLVGSKCLKILIFGIKDHLNEKILFQILNFICFIIEETLPSSLINFSIIQKNINNNDDDDYINKNSNENGGNTEVDGEIVGRGVGEKEELENEKEIYVNNLINQMFESIFKKKEKQLKQIEKEKTIKKIIKESILIENKCLIQLHMFIIIDGLINISFNKISFDQILQLLKTIKKSIKFAEIFNKNIDLRIELFLNKFVTKELPNLLQQQTKGLKIFTRILLLFLKNNTHRSNKEIIFIKGKIIKWVNFIFDNQYQMINSYNSNEKVTVKKEFEKTEILKHIKSSKISQIKEFNPLILFLLTSILNWNNSLFNELIKKIYPKLILLTISENETLRSYLRDIMNRIADIFEIN